MQLPYEEKMPLSGGDYKMEARVILDNSQSVKRTDLLIEVLLQLKGLL